MHDILKRFDLQGKVAAITGAGGELCGVMAEALAKMGVSVAVLDIFLDKAEARAQSIIKAGGTAAPFRCDVRDAEEIQRCCKTITRLWRAPDLLINGAGGNDPRASTPSEFHTLGAPASPPANSFFGLSPSQTNAEPPVPPLPIGSPLPSDGRGIKGEGFFDLDPTAFREVFDLNFFGTFLVTQVFSRAMVERGTGSIVNISSMSAFRPLTKVVAYSAAKASISNFTQWLAVHFAHTGVRVNALAPGFFLTEQLKFLHFDPQTGAPSPRARKVIEHT